MTLRPSNPLLTATEFDALRKARERGARVLECSLDLQLSTAMVEIGPQEWVWGERRFPYPERFKQRTIYYWSGEAFESVSRYASSLIKLVPTDWGPPTFEIDGIKMLPTAHVSPFADAERKVALVRPRGKVILDTCGGLGYFAAWCLRGQAAHILSYEKNPDVIWLRGMNPWSPLAESRLTLTHGDVTQSLASLSDGCVDAVLHDPPRFGIAGELYSQSFYDELARVLKRQGVLFHYTGSPNGKSRGRDLGKEVAGRLTIAGFSASRAGDGIVGVRT